MSKHEHTIMLGSGRLIETTADECPTCLNAEIARLKARLEEAEAAAPDLLKACEGAMNALRSYQYGNSSPDLAKDVSDYLQAIIAKAKEARA